MTVVSPFAPTLLVGSIPAGDPPTTSGRNYIGDPGNGSGIAAALALAGPGKVYVRRGTYDLGAVGAPPLPLTVQGAIEGEGAATVLRMSALDRRVLLLSASDGRASHLQVEFVSAVAGAVGTECIAVGAAAARTKFDHLLVVKAGAAAVNALETLTSIFRGGATAAFRGCNARQIDGNAAASLATFRSFGQLNTFVQCQGLDGDLGVQLDGGDAAVVACAWNASAALLATYSGIVFGAGGDRSRAVACRVGSGAYGVRFLAGATACIAEANSIVGGTVAGIQIDLGATGALVANNQLGGFALVVLEPSALVVNNQP